MKLLNQLRADIGKIVILTREEERDLLDRWFSNHDIEARNELVVCNLPYAIKLAVEVHWKGIDHADLIAEGCIGIMEGIDKFDMSRQYNGKYIRLITYVSHYVYRNIQRYLHNNGHTVRVPVPNHRSINAYEKKVNELRQDIGMEPTNAEIDAIIDEISLENPNSRKAIFATRTSSLDAFPVAFLNCSTTDNEYLDDDERNVQKKMLLYALSKLSDNEQAVIRSFFSIQGEGRTSKELADHYGLSRQSISLIKAKGMERLKRIFNRTWMHPRKSGNLK